MLTLTPCLCVLGGIGLSVTVERIVAPEPTLPEPENEPVNEPEPESEPAGWEAAPGPATWIRFPSCCAVIALDFKIYV